MGGAWPQGQGRVEDYNAAEEYMQQQHGGSMPLPAVAQQRRGSFSQDGFMDDDGGMGTGPARQRGSHLSMDSAASDRTAGTAASGRQNDSAVKMAVRAAAAQVHALQQESRARQRAQTPPAGSNRPNVEVRSLARLPAG